VRIFAVDYLPGRERTYSPQYVLYVLNAEQHAIWITEQLSKWHRLSLEVRDRELALYETNKQLRDLSEEQLNQPEARKRLETQSAAERTNARRLSALVTSGEDLVKQAAATRHRRRPSEQMGRDAAILKDISTNRMPSVADLLKEAAQTRLWAENSPNAKGRAGRIEIRNLRRHEHRNAAAETSRAAGFRTSSRRSNRRTSTPGRPPGNKPPSNQIAFADDYAGRHRQPKPSRKRPGKPLTTR
jgi:hypothetical protein